MRTKLIIADGILCQRFSMIMQDKAARAATRARFDTPTDTLLRQVGWLSIRQLVLSHSGLLVWKSQREYR